MVVVVVPACFVFTVLHIVVFWRYFSFLQLAHCCFLSFKALRSAFLSSFLSFLPQKEVANVLNCSFPSSAVFADCS